MSTFIIPRLIGGLGNQLWTLSAAYAIQQESGKDPQILIPYFCDNPHKNSEQDYFSIFSKFPNCSRIHIPHEYLKGPVEFMFFAHQNGVPFESPQTNSHAPWDPSSTKVPCLLEGYFQNYHVISHHFPKICDLIRSGLPWVEAAAAAATNTVFIHVRRGDYLALPDYHYILDDTYYQQALQHFDTTTNKFLIFSDDIPNCEERTIFKALPNKEFINEPDELKALALMTSCKGGSIIANSTFSYWGAALSGISKVIAPSRWSVDNPQFLFPDYWIII